MKEILDSNNLQEGGGEGKGKRGEEEEEEVGQEKEEEEEEEDGEKEEEEKEDEEEEGGRRRRRRVGRKHYQNFYHPKTQTAKTRNPLRRHKLSQRNIYSIKYRRKASKSKET